MALELTGVLNALGIKLPDGKKVDELTDGEFKSLFDEQYIGKNVAHDNEEIRNKVIGKERGSLATQLKGIFEGIGVDFNGKDVKDGDRLMLDKVLEVGKAESATIIKSLTEDSKKDYDKKLKDLESKLQKAQDDYKTTVTDRDTLKASLETKEKEFGTFRTNLIKEQKEAQAWGGVQFSETANEFTQKGFKTSFREKYTIELADEGDTGSLDGLRIIDNQTKQRVTDGNKFPSLGDIIKKEMAEAKLLKVANTTPEPGKTITKFKTPDGKEKPLNPMAVEIANMQSK